MTTSVSATDDPCESIVSATVRSDAFVFLSRQSGNNFPNFPISRNSHFPLGNPNQQRPPFRGNVLPVYEKFPGVTFRKRVPRWDGPPPSVTFGPKNCQDPADYRLITSYSMALVMTGSTVTDITYNGTTQLKNTRDIALTIKADDLLDLPHP